MGTMKIGVQKRLLANVGIDALNTMQTAANVAIGGGEDTVLLSPTGSGKTLAFLLPLVATMKADEKGVQALVLTPSRELAMQIETVFKKLGTGLKVNCFFGGHSIKEEDNSLKEPPALLIGTPGRIDDHLKRGSLNLTACKVLVLDEFDKLLHLGFQEEMEYVIGRMKGLKQRVLTSATSMPFIPNFVGTREPKELNFLKEETTTSQMKISRVMTEESDKLSPLLELLSVLGNAAVLVFLNHRESVERVGDYLQEHDVVHAVFHGGMEQNDRERSLCKFRNGSVQILITTDLAARGLDIPEIKYVVHYHLTQKLDEFVHRNGRTARMHAEGQVYVMVGPEEQVPGFIAELPEEVLPVGRNLPYRPEWLTVHIGKGKKDKINKIDILGFLCKQGGLDKKDIGLIEVKDRFAYVAVKRLVAKNLLSKVNDKKLKGKRVRFSLAY